MDSLTNVSDNEVGVDSVSLKLIIYLFIDSVFICTLRHLKLLRPLAGQTLYDHKTNDYISRELQITGILDKIDEYGQNWFQHLTKNATNPNPFEIIPLQTTRVSRVTQSV